MIGDKTCNIYDLLEHRRSKSDKVTAPLVSNIKKALDHILKKCTEVQTDNKVMKARLEDRAEYCAMMEDMAQKITRTSVSSMEEMREKSRVVPVKKKEEFTVIVTPNVESQDVNELKEKIKTISKAREDFPTPSDVLVNKNRQVIMKYRNRKEVETARDAMVGSDEVKNVAKVNVPIRRRERILILSVDPKIEEEDIKKEVEAQIEEGGVEDSYVGLTDRLETATLDVTTKALLENLLKKPGREVRVIRKVPTKQGKTNWLLDVESDSKNPLLDKKRICIDFERYHVVEFVSITRCYKCQKFGHMANKCDGEIHCLKCAGDHNIKDCKTEKESWANCYFEASEDDTEHRADSTSCPVFIKYRDSLVPRRS